MLLLLAAVCFGASAFAADHSTTASTASTIVFSPAAVMLDNPTASALRPPATVTVNFTAYDQQGNVLQPSSTNPLHIEVYGAPAGSITPASVQLTSGTAVEFTYNGTYLPHNIELAAWIADPSGGDALGTTLFVPRKRPLCLGSSSFDLKVISNVPDPTRVHAVVGADHPQPSQFIKYTMDTGSLGTLVTKTDMVMGANVHGPGAAGLKYYDSSGYVFTGHYYLAPVSLELTDGSYVQTNPILVLAVEGVHCHKNATNCVKPRSAELHYLGVGFDRNSTGTGDLFDTPSENALLELTDAQNGTDINEGYILSTNGVTAGITQSNSVGFSTYQLSNNAVAGDWNPVPGCYQFTSLTGEPQFCGNLLLDIGIGEMFLDLPSDQRPPDSFDAGTNDLPPNLEMNILAGDKNSPVMSYNFHTVKKGGQPSGPAPTFARWVNKDNIFVNTGRRALLANDYLYSGQCGEVGFKAVTH